MSSVYVGLSSAAATLWLHPPSCVRILMMLKESKRLGTPALKYILFDTEYFSKKGDLYVEAIDELIHLKTEK